MIKYKSINNITGWFLFLVASLTYLLTLEPTASLWDCGEFIATGFKLEVGHPPGCAIFMILTRFFTLLAGSDVTKVAAMANAFSAIMSAFTVLFLFWTITHLAKKLLLGNGSDITTASTIAIMGAGIVGALAFTFSDSFWFSAVEGEVYATSSFFTAIVFWAILKWEECADEKYASRWLLLVFYLIGLSIGVHLLNLLALPAIFLVWYFKRYSFTWKGFIATIALSLGVLAIILWGIILGMVSISAKLDIFFVNSLGLPLNSGMVSHVVLVFALLFYSLWLTINSENYKKTAIASIAAILIAGIWIVSKHILVNIIFLLGISGALWYFAKKGRETTNLIISSLLVVLIGFSSTAIIVIRSSAETPLNENDPSNAVALRYYLSREQYGSSPLVKGPYYNAPAIEDVDTDPVYVYNGERYVFTHNDFERKYDERFVTLFPRMYSRNPTHIEYYKVWGGDNGRNVQVTDPYTGEKSVAKVPTFADNIRFMFSYQFGYMYMRYFMWNFSGKQNDTQGSGGAFSGNWITGIDFIDKGRVGSGNDLPMEMAKDRSRNTYYLLPFILGLIGLFYQLMKDNRNWWVVMLLFIMTGVAIVFYLNQTPEQPRERDYAYVGSFYFFTLWIGLGVVAVFQWGSKLLGQRVAAPLATLVCLSVPILMGCQNWDDHDRSGRYLARDVASNYLESCAPGAILFTNGDNDTFPLWYAQEVEGIRTDVRVCNLMLLNTDWYINQMKKRAYESDPLPITIEETKYYDGINNYVYVVERTKGPVEISTVIDWVTSENNQTKARASDNDYLDIIPTKTIRIPVDRQKVIASGTVAIKDSAKIVPYIDINLTGSTITKSQLMVLNILAKNDWERPIYFVSGYHDDAMGLEEYFSLEGLAYRLVPIKSADNGWLDFGGINTEAMYENVMEKFSWRGANDPKVNVDYHHQRTMSVIRARLVHARLAKALTDEGEEEKAIEVLDHCMEVLPLESIKFDPYVPDLIDAYFKAGNSAKAMELVSVLCDHYYGEIEYFLGQEGYLVQSAEYYIQLAFQSLTKTAGSCLNYQQQEVANEINTRLNEYYSKYMLAVEQVI